ncbi:hypothetical protein SAMN05421821_12443 [Mucilaginibacter lappiensis]|uniref:Uncharacterized protein n=1 Tax=Mucilaginibacter lappiensis TaxID=354630 RepID=A0ABR6PT13_9SPHI|nr:hypothetical protein [Mucilaginibacter lappiensis]SIS09295.1 hypothetical protein SAMN05421821_12443 [Mucilaginibacter lappiensis]
MKILAKNILAGMLISLSFSKSFAQEKIVSEKGLKYHYSDNW